MTRGTLRGMAEGFVSTGLQGATGYRFGVGGRDCQPWRDVTCNACGVPHGLHSREQHCPSCMKCRTWQRFFGVSGSITHEGKTERWEG